MKVEIRKSVLNLPFDAWQKIHEISHDGYHIEVTPQEFVDLIGNSGSFEGCKLNEIELNFANAYWELITELRKIW